MQKLLFICCLFFFLNSSIAQTFEAGLAGGFNFSQIDGDALGGYNQIGFNVGPKVDVVFSDRVRVGIELLLSQQGSRRANNDSPSAALRKLRLDYVEVPLLLKYRDWKFEVGIGGSYARLFNFSAEDINGEDVTDLQDYKDNTYFFVGDLAFFFKENMAVNLRWSKAFNSVRADPGAGRLIGKTVTMRFIFML